MDLVLIPLDAAFRSDLHATFCNVWVLLAKSLFWTTDMVYSFFVGYFENGRLEVNPRKTAPRYVRTWFLPDFALASIDWVVFIIQVEIGNAHASTDDQEIALITAVRVVRLVRFGRLLRLVKLHKW